MKKYVSLFVVAVFLIRASSPLYALEITIEGNGSNGSNEVMVMDNTEDVVIQSSEADIVNDISLDTNTGGNEVISNNSDQIIIDTGDASEVVEVNNSVNISVVELDCCNDFDDTIVVSANGNDSTNSVVFSNNTTNTSLNTNNATVTNNITLNADTGNNSAIANTGDVFIKTGEISVNIGVLNGPVNSNSVKVSVGGGISNLFVSENGSGSKNIVLINNNSATQNYISNSATILNNVGLTTNTGGNKSDFNSGSTAIITGNIFVDIILNNGPVNSNFSLLQCCSNLYDPADTSDPDPTVPADPDVPDEIIEPGIGGYTYDDPSDPPSDSSVAGAILASAASTVVDAIEVLGLSNTSSGDYSSSSSLYALGIIMFAAGIGMVSSANISYASRKKS